MNNILQWEPEKSRVWANARIENIHRLREDLGTLAELIKAKADAASLGSKADQGLVSALEKGLGETREAFESFQRKTAETAQALQTQLELLAEGVKSGEATLAECRRIEGSLRQLETETREAVRKGLAAAEEQAATANLHALDAKDAAEKSAAFKTECAEAIQALRKKAEELTSAWEEVRQTFTHLSGAVEQNAAKVVDLTQGAQEALGECQSKAQEIRDLHRTFGDAAAEAQQRLTELVRQAEAQAAATAQNAQSTTAASQLAGSLRSECEGLIQTLMLKSEELSSTCQGMERDFSEWSSSTQQNAAKATEAARQSQELLSECQATVRTNTETRAGWQASEEEIKRQLSRLEELVREAQQHASRTADHWQGCQKLDAHMAATQAQTRSLAQSAEEQLRRVERDAALFQQRSGTFFGRLKWLLWGSDSPGPVEQQQP